MVREITLMEYFQNNLKIKCEKIKKGTIKKSSLEEFVFFTNLNPEQIENNIIEFYMNQGYELLDRNERAIKNLHLDYYFKREKEIKKIKLTLSPKGCLAIVYQDNVFKCSTA